MAHNPRRSRSPETAQPPILTKEQIAAAMNRAVELRRRSSRVPDGVAPQPMTAHDAVRMTENYRLHSHWYQISRIGTAEPDPWYWIGWVNEEIPAHCRERDLWLCWHRTWEVWLNVADGRVWLKPEHRVRRQDPDDPYP